MPNERKAAPKADYTQQADTMHVIDNVAGLSADTDLLRIPGKPRFAPQLTVLYNRHATDDATIIMTPEKGTDLTFTIRAGEILELYTPFKKVEDTGTTGGTMVCHFYWWDLHGSLNWNAES